MINKNLGILERAIRLALSSLIFLWLSTQNVMGPLQWVAAVAALFLCLNAIFSRCYLWFWLKIDTCDGEYQDCTKRDC